MALIVWALALVTVETDGTIHGLQTTEDGRRAIPSG